MRLYVLAGFTYKVASMEPSKVGLPIERVANKQTTSDPLHDDGVGDGDDDDDDDPFLGRKLFARRPMRSSKA